MLDGRDFLLFIAIIILLFFIVADDGIYEVSSFLGRIFLDALCMPKMVFRVKFVANILR